MKWTQWEKRLEDTLRVIAEKSEAEKYDIIEKRLGFVMDTVGMSEPFWLLSDFVDWGLIPNTDLKSVRELSWGTHQAFAVIDDLASRGLLENHGVLYSIAHFGRIQLTRWRDGKDGAPSSVLADGDSR